MECPHLLFVTGKLAESALRRTLDELAPRAGFRPSVAVLPITVVALATTPWIARHLTIPAGVSRVILPGLCAGDLGDLAVPPGVAVERGPKDMRDLPDYFNAANAPPADLSAFDIEIIAEINHAPRLALADVLEQAKVLRAAGADLIDVGCDPGDSWPGAGECVRALREAGLRVSIDSFNAAEVAAAVRNGAELVLSVNGGNVDAARDWRCEVVVLPDDIHTLAGLDRTIEKLTAWGVPFRLDPVIEPIGFGFAASLGRYLEAQRRYPDAAMMMGVGNLTELTDADSAGLNVLLLGFCQEVGIRSVLTTQVINWCRSSVRELDLARRLVYHAVTNRVLPKHLAPDLVLLRDAQVRTFGTAFLAELASSVTDRNFRIFAEDGRLHVVNDKMHLQGPDPFDLFDEMRRREDVDSSHAFYLGFEMAKALTALTLGKNYTQDQALRWGLLTVPERGHRAKVPGETELKTDGG